MKWIQCCDEDISKNPVSVFTCSHLGECLLSVWFCWIAHIFCFLLPILNHILMPAISYTTSPWHSFKIASEVHSSEVLPKWLLNQSGRTSKPWISEAILETYSKCTLRLCASARSTYLILQLTLDHESGWSSYSIRNGLVELAWWVKLKILFIFMNMMGQMTTKKKRTRKMNTFLLAVWLEK